MAVFAITDGALVTNIVVAEAADDVSIPDGQFIATLPEGAAIGDLVVDGVIQPGTRMPIEPHE